MERRDFLIKSGTVLTAAAFVSNFGRSIGIDDSISNSESKGNDKKRPDPNSFSQPILKAIALGINAPSPHNTQSWKFKIINELEMDLFVDENVLLPATDPPSRQIHMGAGCFIETMILGAQRLGYTSKVLYFPEGYETQKDFGKKPVARIQLVKAEVEVDILSGFIESRQTNRRKFKGDIVSKTEFDQIHSLTGKCHSKVIFINDGIEEYFDLFLRAFEVESRTYRTNEETRNLFRFSEEQRAEKRDGISIPQMGYKGLIKNIAEKSLEDGDHDKWHSNDSIELSLKNVQKGIESSKGFVVWYTESNEYIDWVKSGRDYVRFDLALTKNGLYAHPYNQAIQEYDEMKEVRDELDQKIGMKDPQKIQMIVRIGRSSQPYYSYRRTLDAYLIN